jgi:exonuclease SbcC
MERCQAAWKAEEIRQHKESEALKSVIEIENEIEALKRSITQYELAADGKTTAENTIAGYEAAQKQVEAETAKKQKHLEANAEKMNGYMKLKDEYDAKVKAVEAERDRLCDERQGIDRLILTAENNIKLNERDAQEFDRNCPECGQQLTEAALAQLTAKRETAVNRVEQEKAVIEGHLKKQAELSKAIEEIDDKLADLSLESPNPVNTAPFDETELKKLIAQRDVFDIARARDNLAKAQEAGVRIEGFKSQLTDKGKLLEERKKVVAELTAGVTSDFIEKLRNDLETATANHNSLTEAYTDTREKIAGLESSITAVKKTLTEITAQEQELKALAETLYAATKEHVEWELVVKAFGRDGIQALELDALAPGISDTANKILESAYGDRFKIAIETTRIGGAGKKVKQIEDFVIKVIDDGEEANLEDKSGGEAVWIKRAIYDAFAVIRKRNTNFAFLSCFQDETDGALDSASKTSYCRMLEAAHAESKLRHTFVITHSNEVKAMIEQKIDMEELAA